MLTAQDQPLNKCVMWFNYNKDTAIEEEENEFGLMKYIENYVDTNAD